MSSRLIRHQHTHVVEAAPDVVWSLACEVPRYPEWVEVTLEIIEADPEALVGSRYVEPTRVFGPVTVVGHWTVAGGDDDARFKRHECRDEPGPVKGMWLEMRATPEGSGTRFDLTIGCRIGAGVLTRPMAAALSPQLRRGNAGNIKRFAALAESQVTLRRCE